MTRLLALLFALFVPHATARPFSGVARQGRTHLAGPAKPFGDLAAEAAIEALHRRLTGLRDDCRAAGAALQSLAAAAVDGNCPPLRTAPGLVAFVAGSAQSPVARWLTRTATTARHLLAPAERRFSSRFPHPGHARLAGTLFVASVTLAAGGLVGIGSLAPAPPTAHLQQIARAVALTVPSTLQAAEGPKSETATVEAEAAVEAATEKAAAAAPAPAPAPVVLPPVPPASRGALPIGKGMWIWLPERADGGDPAAIVARARAAGLTHLYVRTGTKKGGFMAGPFLDQLLPVAHAAGLRVYGWDFPYLIDPGSDVTRAVAAINYTTPDGHRIDGFSSDIESTAEGTNNDVEYVRAYVTWLRQNVGPDYPLIATIPNPTAKKVAAGFPYAEVVSTFDAVAPMVYWMNRDPGTDVTNAIAYLSQFGKPVFPVGQAYDGAPEGGPAGPPGRDAMIRFMQHADAAGAPGVSFWSYQHATQEAWDAIRDAAEFRLPEGGPDGAGLTAGMVRAYQTNLNSLGFPVAADGAWGPATTEAVLSYQRAARLQPTGRIDRQTRAFLLTPVAAPVRPDGH